MTVRWTVRTGGTPCPQTRQVLFGAPKTEGEGSPSPSVFYTNYKLELQFALRIALLRAEIKGKKERPRKRGS